MKFYFDNTKAIFKGTQDEVLKISGQDHSFNLFENKEYLVRIRCESKRNFHYLSFSFEWNDENVIPNFNGEALDFEIGNKLESQNYTVIAEKVADESEIVVSIDTLSEVNITGTFDVLVFKFTVKTKGVDVFLFIEVQEIL